MRFNLKDTTKNILIWSAIIIGLMIIFQSFSGKSGSQVAYSDFLNQVDNGTIRQVEMTGGDIRATTSDGSVFNTLNPETSNGALIDAMRKANVQITAKSMKGQSLLLSAFFNLLPILLLVGFWIFIMRSAQGGGGKNPMSFGKSKAKMLSEDQIKVTFADVAGADEAKQEVAELVEFLRDPSKFQRLGGKIPRGILMVGAPGTGKTLLAKAIAGEARVPFFTISGSDFVEMFVGVGASRVRDMFEQAKKFSPCIIFIDEIDAVGRQRGAGLGGGHDEREQTLNQLLVEMDGFEGNEGVIIIAATNRPDVLDSALLRPGRFDRQVVVPLPDVKGREQILNVHLRKVPAAADIIPFNIARGTPGFSGADLANLVNEAALFAARTSKLEVCMEDLEKAKDKIMMGAERRSMVLTLEDRKLTAYHEAGHAIVGYILKSDPIYKVTIIPRGRALGVTFSLPERDHLGYKREWIENKLAMICGGRIAEELIFGKQKVTNGASSDIQTVTSLAKAAVTQWGFSDKLGFLSYAESEGEVFLGRSVTQHKTVSDVTAHIIDEEVQLLVHTNYLRAEEVLKGALDKMHKMVEVLLEIETINAEQIDDIMHDRPIRESHAIDLPPQAPSVTPSSSNTPPEIDAVSV